MLTSTIACSSVQVKNYFPIKWTPLVPTIVFLSFLWSFWDPTWHRVRNARTEGRPIKAQGRKQWIVCSSYLSRVGFTLMIVPFPTQMWQSCSWLARLLSSVALTISPLPSWWLPSHVAFELSVSDNIDRSDTSDISFQLLYLSFHALHIVKPPSVVLTSSVPRSRSLTPYPTTIVSANPAIQSFPPPPSQADDLLSSLSLSSQPTPTRRSSAPVFGETSALRASRPIAAASSTLHSSEPMDWTPAKGGMQEEGWMRPQRFFPPSDPTGLEDLLSRTQIDDGDRRRQTMNFKLAEMVGWNGGSQTDGV